MYTHNICQFLNALQQKLGFGDLWSHVGEFGLEVQWTFNVAGKAKGVHAKYPLERLATVRSPEEFGVSEGERLRHIGREM